MGAMANNNMAKEEKWGFLRETRIKASKAGLDKDTGLHRTGMEDYLRVIFPNINEYEWIHDQKIPGFEKRIRPDYRCEKIKLIIEFDGTQHYKQPDTIKKDKENQMLYEKYGYTVVRIPYFIQLTNDVVKQMFGIDVKVPLFNPLIPSMGSRGRNTPAYCCPAGIKRMAEDFKKYPGQYKVNMNALKNGDEFLTGYRLLKEGYDSL